jgi:FtsZ-binding cell division protein ZapB
MSVIDVSKALRHVHNQLDVEKQWLRAISGLAPMTHLQRAQVWADLSSHTLGMDAQKAPVVLSQYKALYKAALKTVDAQLHAHSGGGEGTCDGAVWEMLEEYKEALELFKMEAVTMQHEIGEGGERVVKVVSGGGRSAEDIKKVVENVITEQLKALRVLIEARLDSLTSGKLGIDAGTSDQFKTCLDAVNGLETRMKELATKVESVALSHARQESVEGLLDTARSALNQVVMYEGKMKTATDNIAAIQTDLTGLHKKVDSLNPSAYATDIITKSSKASEALQQINNNLKKTEKAVKDAEANAAKAEKAATRSSAAHPPP